MLRHFATFALLLTGLTGAASGYDVVLRREAVVVESIVRLGDLAEIAGPSQRFVQELEQLELFPAPSCDRSRFVTINDIRAQLSARGFHDADLYFTGASRTRIVRTSGTAPISEAVRSTGSGVQRTSWDGGPLAEGETLVVHTVRPIRRGEVIQAKDLTVQPLNIIRTEGDFETRIEALVGKEAIRSLPAQRPIESGSVQEPIVIHQNDVVTVIAKIGGLAIRRDAIAVSDAAVGQLLTVQAISPDSRRGQERGEVFQVRAIGHGQAMTLNSDERPQTTVTAYQGAR
ncbi:flagellar basal body P-ring formation chaperone FlgA [Blastopirellula sp. JC732]|uniref:Flagellar basal body P-ring formation chaperone FlgA n=1 Tax=Blastopirellula sediminis TaxID=2894196 RepID=A0A9X1SFC6_9BACT|nr:flagellar basal body P-ring formation chaperone FlgA [Blastopirellula sediminis]MCC9607672.1 flagellar basal body P-ring formation chaperone FlgA [Blastopirellula sediminis]MCC9629035.1 flagellar basal body P-ring formation chaperone FlgA [Blastopirellula sediminis]